MRKVLIVEDNEINRRVLRSILSKEYDVLEAENGRDALDILHKKHKMISAVLLDIMMPVMDGFEVLRQMRNNAMLSQIPVIVATGSEDDDTEVRALALGANDFVVKPYNPVLILHCLRNTINLRETASIVNAIQRDKLTGLYNRETFFDKVGAMIREHPPGYYVMACFDINGFKVINDQYGAQEGDRILQQIGNMAREGFASVGGISSRISADNFAALYPFGNYEVDFITNRRDHEFSKLQTHATLSFSVGRYVVTDLSLPCSAIYDRAFIAKQSIKGRYDVHTAYFSESMRDRLLEEQAIIGEMDAALINDHFETWFQPQFNHATGALIGAEALVRWRHPEKGLIMPNSFIPVFEQNGFIYELDKYIWEQVIKKLREWTDAGRNPLPVSINISRYDIFRDDFFITITGLLEKYRLPIDLLRLEITESAFAKSSEQIIAAVKQLIDYGFTVEIDDFGSGYSSLNTLKDVPATVLKLDMKFLETVGDSQRGGNIIESIVRMAKWLGMSVIAEGVETREQADYLKTIGCYYIQGYLYAKPMPVSEYEALAKKAEKEERLLSLETVENLDNNTFWDPSSMDTLIFNSYVGGACIFEYHNGTIELLRANDKYSQVIGSAGITVEDALKLSWADHLDEKNGAAVNEALQLSINTGDSVTGEFMFKDLPGCPEETYLRSTMRVIATSGDHYLVYCTNENTTAQHQAEKREHQTSEHLRAIMSNINGGVTAAIMDGDTPLILFANEQFYVQLGYTKEQYEAEVTSPHDLIHPDDRARVVEQTIHASESNRAFTSIYRVIRRDKTVRWLQNNISITSFADIKGPVQLAVANDITELREAEERERRASEQVRAIMDDVGSGITATVMDDGVRFLIANDKYFEIHGYTREQYNAEVSDLFELIHPDDRAAMKEISARAYREESSARAEYRITRRDGARRWLRAILSSTRFTGVDQPVQLCILTDITAEKDSEQALRETDEQLRFLNDMAHDLLAQSDSERGIEDILTKLLDYFSGKRAYIFEFDHINRLLKNTYEVCSDGVISEKANLQDVPFEACEFWLNLFETDNYVNIADVDALDERRPEKGILQAQGIKSLIAVPLRRDGSLIGLMGIDDPAGQRELVNRMAALGDYIAVMLTRRDLNAKIASDNDMLLGLMNDTPGGFVRMRVNKDGKSAVPVYFNDGFCKLTGMSYAELMDLYGNDVFAAVHPDDMSVVRDAMERMLTHGEVHNATYRLRHGNGSYIWLMIFGRRAQSESGETFLNIYYTDVSEQNRLEEQRRELLENLPCGAGIYEIDNNNIRATYLNKRYRAYLNRDIGDLSEAPVMEVVHPDDVERLMEALQKTLLHGLEGTCDIRIMDGRGGYIPFRLVGSAMERTEGRKAIYVTFTPIPREIVSFNEMLPVAFAAMMSASTDFAFVKDGEQRYVCCSRAFARLVGLDSEHEIVGKTDYDLFDRALADKYIADDRRIMDSGESLINITEPIPSLDGKPRYAVTSKYLLYDTFGSVIGLYGAGRDVTGAREADSQLNFLNDSIPGGLATYDCSSTELSPDGIRITYFNDGFCRLFGFTREEYEKISSSGPISMVFAEDKHILEAQHRLLITENTPVNCLYRAHVKGGGYKWISHKSVAADRKDGRVLVNAVLLDVTELQETAERLRISEEEHRLAIAHSGNIICRYTAADRSLSMSPEFAALLSIPERMENVPEGPVRQGLVSADSAAAYIGLFESIRRGDKSGTATFQHRMQHGWRWLTANHSTILSSSGEVVSAVISFYDVTDHLEKEAVYKKWQQSLNDKDPAAYTLFRCNMSKDASFDTVEGSLLTIVFDENELATFNDRTEEYVRQFVFDEDRERYAALLNSNTLLANYYRGKRSEALEYREKLPMGGVRWLRVTIDLVEYPNSTDVEAYMMYENIDDSKRAELLTLERAQNDPLTGVLNRATFASRADQIIRTSGPEAMHALLMMDVDGFKMVNDVFGHGAGDQALIDIADAMRSALRRGDLIGRLGGDEFVVFLSDIPNDAVAHNKAKQICELVHKSFSVEVQISGSVGIAVCPRDGTDYNALYKRVDAALYYVKGSGKNGCAFYRDDMDDQHLTFFEHTTNAASAPAAAKKRRMLIVDDSVIDYEMLNNIFMDDFVIEKAKDGNSALIRLRHYGSAISVVLLDLMMPGMDGFAVLDKMRSSAELRSIPVVVVIGDDDRETSLLAIRSGASDFVTKPVDPDLLRIRVQSAISKAENERLRAHNSFLELESNELTKYRTVIERTGTVLIEHDWGRGTFIYDPHISAVLSGVWDERKLWHVMLSDMVADVAAVKAMQELVHSVAEDKKRMDGCMYVTLKAANKAQRRFRMDVYKRTNEFQIADKLIITFRAGDEPAGDNRKV